MPCNWAGRKGQAGFPWENRMQVAYGCAVALAFMHSKKVIHRDFKASNVLLSKVQRQIPGKKPKEANCFGAKLWISIQAALRLRQGAALSNNWDMIQSPDRYTDSVILALWHCQIL